MSLTTQSTQLLTFGRDVKADSYIKELLERAQKNMDTFKMFSQRIKNSREPLNNEALRLPASQGMEQGAWDNLHQPERIRTSSDTCTYVGKAENFRVSVAQGLKIESVP